MFRSEFWFYYKDQNKPKSNHKISSYLYFVYYILINLSCSALVFLKSLYLPSCQQRILSKFDYLESMYFSVVLYAGQSFGKIS